MKSLLTLIAVAVTLAAASSAHAGVITSVTPSGSSGTYTIRPDGTMGQNATEAYTDFAGIFWVDLASPNGGMALLTGADWVATAVTADKGNASLSLDVVVSGTVDMYVWIDDRAFTTGGVTPPSWMAAAGFVDTGMDIDLAVAADSPLGVPFSIYQKSGASGTVTLGAGVGANTAVAELALYGFGARAVEVVPTPAALPAGLMLIGMTLARRRSK